MRLLLVDGGIDRTEANLLTGYLTTSETVMLKPFAACKSRLNEMARRRSSVHATQVTRTSACLLVVMVGHITVGCAVPYPAPKLVVTPGGAQPRTEPDVSQLRLGVTDREEVRRIFEAVYVWEGDRTFVGRWARSGMGDTMTGRYWGGRNLLIAFDAKGTVERFKVCGEAEFLEELRAFLNAESGTIDPLMISAAWAMQPDEIEEVEAIFVGNSREKRPAAATVRLRLRMHKTAGGKRLRFLNTDVPTLVIYARYLNQKEK